MKKGQAPLPNGGMTCPDNGFKTHPYTGNFWMETISAAILNYMSRIQLGHQAIIQT